MYLYTRTDGQLFNLSRLRSTSKIRKILIRDLLFTDDAAVATDSEPQRQDLMNRFIEACNAFKLTICLKKNNTCQEAEGQHVVKINNYKLELVKEFPYLRSIVTDDLSMDSEIARRIGFASSTFAMLTKRVWEVKKLKLKTKITVYSPGP